MDILKVPKNSIHAEPAKWLFVFYPQKRPFPESAHAVRHGRGLVLDLRRLSGISFLEVSYGKLHQSEEGRGVERAHP